MALDGNRALALLSAIGNANSQKEYYLTDIVTIARSRGLDVAAAIAAEDEVLGVNDRAQLAAAEAILQTRLRAKAMREGATLIDPSSVTLAFDTVLGRDVVIEPHVVFGPGVSVGEGSVIRSFSYLEGAAVGQNAAIGPFARLRPGADTLTGCSYRQFRRGEGLRGWCRRENKSFELYRRRKHWRQNEYRRGDDYLQL